VRRVSPLLPSGGASVNPSPVRVASRACCTLATPRTMFIGSSAGESSAMPTPEGSDDSSSGAGRRAAAAGNGSIAAGDATACIPLRLQAQRAADACRCAARAMRRRRAG
jgi:hypothetical protein